MSPHDAGAADDENPATAFERLSDYVALPRVSGLALSPDGTRLVTSVSTLSADSKKWVSALWQIDPTGAEAPVRLTRSAPGENHPVFAPDGTLLFVSRRPDPQGPGPHEKDADDKPSLWALPARGEAREVLRRPGGVGSVAVARVSGDMVVSADILASAADLDDEQIRKDRTDAGVSAILHERYPVRSWDHDLGPDHPHLLAVGSLPERSGPYGSGTDPRTAQSALDGARLGDARDLTPNPGGHLGEEFAISDDGTRVAYIWSYDAEHADHRQGIVVADVARGERLLEVHDPDHEYESLAWSPTGASLACVRWAIETPEEPPQPRFVVVDVASGEIRELAPSFPLWPGGLTWSTSGEAIFFTADEQGHAPVFRLDAGSGEITRLSAAGAHSDVVAAPDGKTLYALRTGYDAPPHPIRLDSTTADQDGAALPAPGGVGPLPGRLTEISTQADDGVPIRAWLALPGSASATKPAPLLLWIHGGPLSSANAWSWRWNPWLLVSQGYAVLLPDPALSTGYGQDFIRRGWGTWGERPYSDLMTVTDAASRRDDIDADRTAAMGGSFGGYMANWIAGHTDRFKAIVTHASLWNLQQFASTTDFAAGWYREFGDPAEHADRYVAQSPHRFVDKIVTPMLVVHGDKDYRVPIGEGISLWFDLQRAGADARFLYFPDENHWVLTPGNATVWYETVRAFLAEKVLGQKWERPALI
ncbi:MAG: alpha/beta fold hydrolase [Mycobacteriales bacterium]|nr:MAG: S9 family peptidase [Pseudonocardiales bacterium]